jgi:hypothetical protein
VPANLFGQPFAQTMALQKMPGLENSNLFRQPVQLQVRAMPHRLNLTPSILHGRGSFFSDCFQETSLPVRSRKILQQILDYLF